MRNANLSFIALTLCFMAGTADSLANEATISVPVDASLRVSTKFFEPARCNSKASRTFHFQVGDLQLAADTVLDGRLHTYTIKESPDRKSRTATLPKMAGCVGTPLRFVQVGLRPGKKELPPSVVFKELPPESGQPRVAKFIQHLGRTGACKATKLERLMLCSGSKTENGTQVPLMFFVVQDGTGKVPTVAGIPIHAKCEGQPDGMLCSVAVRLSPTVELSAGIEPMAITPVTIAKIGAELESAGRLYAVER